MPTETKVIRVKETIKGSPEHAYYAFTNAAGLREWLCDVATVQPRPGGRMYLWWNGDYFSNGTYTKVVPNQLVEFEWFGKDEPAPTQVKVTLAEKNGQTLVTLAHTVPASKKWSKHAEGFKREWKTSFENLKSVLETGRDKRLVDRPMLGIAVGDFNAKQAKRLGIPVKEGSRVDDTIEGMGARAAGLRKDDVIVSMGGKPITSDFSTIAMALEGKKGGDKIEVVYYRGPEKRKQIMELSRRRVPDVPDDPGQLAKMLKDRLDEDYGKLQKAFEGVSEAQASHHPAPEEWSAQEVLAHLIEDQRATVIFFDDLVSGQERWSDDFGDNVTPHMRAMVTAFGSTSNLLVEYRRLSDEIVNFIRNFPPDFVKRKGGYFRLGWGQLDGQTHVETHLEQIKAAIASAPK